MILFASFVDRARLTLEALSDTLVIYLTPTEKAMHYVQRGYALVMDEAPRQGSEPGYMAVERRGFRMMQTGLDMLAEIDTSTVSV